jgi:hypothetical protein
VHRFRDQPILIDDCSGNRVRADHRLMPSAIHLASLEIGVRRPTAFVVDGHTRSGLLCLAESSSFGGTNPELPRAFADIALMASSDRARTCSASESSRASKCAGDFVRNRAAATSSSPAASLGASGAFQRVERSA